MTMPWQDAQTIAFTRLEIVSQVPPAAGVFGVMDGANCLLVGESWNLRARLLELANVLDGQTHLNIIFEVCPEEKHPERKAVLTSELLQRGEDDGPGAGLLPGLSLRNGIRRSA